MPDAGGSAPGRPLVIEGLRKSYGAHVVLDDVNLTIPHGRFVTLLGPSGSGKTTILLSIAGFVEPSGGCILLGGEDLTTRQPEDRNIGMMFQGYALFPHMSVEENVWFPLRVRGVSRAAAREAIRAAIDMVQMGAFLDRKPAMLSGGQQQRVALARALVFKPDLVLLDEPLSALDKNLRQDLQIELKQLQQRLGVTFINVTHDQEEALSMSDEIVVLNDGRIEQHGAPFELFERPRTRFVADFLGKSNFVEGRVTGSERGVTLYEAGDTTLRHEGPAPAGAAAVFALKPSQIALGSDASEGMNAVDGDVLSVTYLGATCLVRARCGALGELQASVPAASVHGRIRERERVRLCWKPSSTVPVLEGPQR